MVESRVIGMIQPQQIVFEWCWLYLAVDVREGRLFLCWQERLRSDCVGEWKQAGIDALIWDNAPSHRSKVVRETGMSLGYLPPFSPELNPAERVFEEVRRWVEGVLYDSVSDKRAAVERYLCDLASDPSRVKRLASWRWIRESLQALPNPQQQQQEQQEREQMA
jgi:transposase